MDALLHFHNGTWHRTGPFRPPGEQAFCIFVADALQFRHAYLAPDMAFGDMTGFAEEVRALAARFPDARSATIPALRLAQERRGWLPPEAFREVADALDLTPAYCHAVASFYDMFHLEPVGRRMVEVCTNLPCALAGAQRVVDAFVDELGVEPGGTTADGEITFRTFECLGGCGYATVVAIDNRYREHVTPEDVPAIVEELRA